MKKNIKGFLKGDSFNNVTASIIAIAVGLLFGFVVLLLTDAANAAEGMSRILLGGFTGGGKGIGQVFYLATPLIMTGLSVAFAFKTGLFNIGASGQFSVGAAVAIFVGVNIEMPAPFHWIFAILMAALAGAAWGSVPGLLKAYTNTHEVISSIMMNYIGMYLSIFIIKQTSYDSTKNISADIAESASLPKAGLDKIFSSTVGTYTDSSAINIGIFIAIALAIVVYIILNKTTFGYELKACGHNQHSSKYAGINAKRNVVLAMTIAGALAGIGGALVFLTGEGGRHMGLLEELAAEGFNGIPVSLLALSNPIGVIFTAIFVAYLTQGGSYLQMLGFMPELIEIIVAVIIYFSAFALIFKQVLPTITNKLEKRKKQKQKVKKPDIEVQDKQEATGGEK